MMITRLLPKSALGLSLGWLLLGVAAIAWGRAQPLNAAAMGFVVNCEDSEQPCWYGIRLGKTTMDRAKRIVERNGYYNPVAIDHLTLMYSAPPGSRLASIVFVHQNNMIRLLGLYPQPGVHLGDFMQASGAPDGLWLTSPRLFVTIMYQRGRLGIMLDNRRANPLTPQRQDVKAIILRTNYGRSLRWRGLAPVWRYCQLEPLDLGCR
jgi:hypothetical protein